MSDDDLFSLDFTQSPPPPPAAAPAPAAKPGLSLELVPVDAPAPAAPPAAPPVPAPPHMPEPAPPAAPARVAPPPALIEAAHLFARGDDLGASRRLEAALKGGEKLGDFAQRVWLALFDVLHVLGRKDAHGKLAAAYGKRFGAAAPGWYEPPAAGVPAVAGDFALPVALDGTIGERLKAITQRIGADAEVVLDARAVRSIDDNGCLLLLRLLTSLKKAGKACAVRGAKPLIALLQAEAPVGERVHEPLWLLQLDLLQRVGEQEPFEEAAINFAVTFELSPPSWDPASVVTIAVPADDDAPPASVSVGAQEGLTDGLAGELKGCRVERFGTLLAAPPGGGDCVVEARELVRIDDPSAAALVQAASIAAGIGTRIVIRDLPQLVEVLLREHGLATHATLELRSN